MSQIKELCKYMEIKKMVKVASGKESILLY